MLKDLRKKGFMKKVLWIVAVVIILSFGLFSKGYLLKEDGPTKYAGKIFGRKVSLKEFQENAQQVHIQALLQHGKNFEKVKPFLDLQSQTWDRIIILQEAKRKKVKVTDKEVVDTIKKLPFFKRNNRFDPLLYKTILSRSLNILPNNFEKGLRDTLKISKLYEKATFSVTAKEEELADAYMEENEKLQVSYIPFNNDDYKKDVVPDEDQIKNYYLEHKEDFKMPPSIKVEYLVIGTPETAEELETQELAYEIAKQLSQRASFEKVAKDNNLVIRETGFFSMENPDLTLGWSYSLIQKLFQSKTKDIIGPVSTKKGMQVLRVKENSDSFIPEYEEAKEKATEAWSRFKAKEIAKNKAQEALAILNKNFDAVKRPDFTKISKNNNFTLKQTPIFVRDQYLPEIGISRDFQNAAFSLDEDNKLSGVVKVSTGYAILHLDSRIQADMETFDKNKEEIQKQLLMKKKNQVFNEYVSQLKIKAKLEDNISDMLDE